MAVRYLTTAEVAALYGVSAHTITRWSRDGRIPAIKVGRYWFHHPALHRDAPHHDALEADQQ